MSRSMIAALTGALSSMLATTLGCAGAMMALTLIEVVRGTLRPVELLAVLMWLPILLILLLPLGGLAGALAGAVATRLSDVSRVKRQLLALATALAVGVPGALLVWDPSVNLGAMALTQFSLLVGTTTSVWALRARTKKRSGAAST